VRDGETTPSPTPDFMLRPGDTVVVVGTPQGIEKASELMSSHLPVALPA
jgi:TrkA domain protein